MLVKLTKEQAAMVHWALHAGLEQQRKFLMHDDWDVGMSEDAVSEVKRIERQFEKAAKSFHQAFMKALGDK